MSRGPRVRCDKGFIALREWGSETAQEVRLEDR